MPKRSRYAIYVLILALAGYMYFFSDGRVTVHEDQLSKAIPWSKTGNLNVRSDTITNIFQKSPYNLRFEFVPFSDGLSRFVGRSMDGLILVELVGPSDGLVGAVMMAALPEENDLVVLRNLNALLSLVRLAMPEWTNSEDWLSSSIPAAFDNQPISIIESGKTLTLRVVPNTTTLVMSIRGPSL